MADEQRRMLALCWLAYMILFWQASAHKFCVKSGKVRYAQQPMEEAVGMARKVSQQFVALGIRGAALLTALLVLQACAVEDDIARPEGTPTVPPASDVPLLEVSISPPLLTPDGTLPPPPTVLPSSSATYAPNPEAARILAAGNRNMENGNYASAINDYSLALRADAAYAEAAYRRGMAWAALGNDEAALSDYALALTLDPHLVAAYVARARLYHQCGDSEAALADLAQAEALDPRYGETYLVRAHLYRDLGDAARALEDFNRAVLLMPQRVEAYIGRALLYEAGGDLTLAQIDLNVALAINPDHAEAYHARGRVRAAQGDLVGALADYEQAYDLGLRDTALSINLAELYLVSGDSAAARRTLNAALIRDPTNAEAHYWLGLTLLAEGDYDAAVGEANLALVYQPDSAAALGLRATAYLYLERWQRAIEDFRAAYALDPAYVDALFGIAQAQIRQGDTQGALATLEAYLSIVPAEGRNRAAASALRDWLLGTATPSVSATPTLAPPTGPP